jgi:hypothetical protein
MTAGPARALPRRDDDARARLREVGRRAQPIVLARDRRLLVPGEVRALLPGGALQRGSTVTVEGGLGAGATSLALELAAAATAAGEWAGAIDLDGTFGGEAAAQAGVVLERFAVIRATTTTPPGEPGGLPPASWAVVVAALLDGVSVVLAEVPRYATAGDARRLVARARERGAVLVPLVVAPGARWPADASVRLRATGGCWHGLVPGAGLLTGRACAVTVDGEGEAARPRTAVLARAG